MSVEWSEEELDILYELSYLGAAEVARAIEFDVGTKRSVRAVQEKAYREGVSLLRSEPYETCPLCGETVDRLTRDGYCRECSIQLNVSRQKEINRRIKEEKEEKDRRAKDAKREYERVVKANQRLRKRGFSADL